MGCAPLQAMYLMAAGTGNPLQGAKFLLLFGLGNLLALLGFAFFAVLLSPAAMRQLVSVSGILVIVMGLMMVQRGLKLLNVDLSTLLPTSTVPNGVDFGKVLRVIGT